MNFKKNPFHDRVKTEQTTRKDGTNYTVREFKDRYFFPDEWKATYDNLRESQKTTFNFLICTGARINEIRNVKVKDIDFERNNIVFRWTKSRNKDRSRKIRTIPISSQFAKYLRKIIRENNLKLDDKLPVLSTPAANMALKGNPTMKTKGALQRAGIPDWKMFSVHNIRKTTEMWLIALGIEENKVARHMGHTEKVQQKHYVSTELFNWQDKDAMRQIIGDIYRER